MFLLIDSGASRIVSHSAAKRFSDVCTLSDRQTAAQNVPDIFLNSANCKQSKEKNKSGRDGTNKTKQTKQTKLIIRKDKI